MDNIVSFKSDPNNLKYFTDLTQDSFSHFIINNIFIIFKSFSNINYLVYMNKNFSIISIDLNNNKILTEIKKPHAYGIINFRHFFDKINNKDLILSI